MNKRRLNYLLVVLSLSFALHAQEETILFGQQKGIIRFFIRKNVNDYNWKTPILIQLFV